MDKYLITCSDWSVLEYLPEALCQQFERFLNCQAIYLAPVLFAEYSCLTQFVYEEIDLVVTNQQKQNDARLKQDDFIEFWGWKDKLETKVYHLSGGWRKLLGVSLFLNRNCENMLFIDLSSHFSDGTIEFILDRMKRLAIHNVGFAEYDQEIIKGKLDHFYQIKQMGTRLV